MNLLGTWVGNPSDDDSVASVPCLEDGEWNVWLATLASEESSLGGEGQGTELQKRTISLDDNNLVVQEGAIQQLGWLYRCQSGC